MDLLIILGVIFLVVLIFAPIGPKATPRRHGCHRSKPAGLPWMGGKPPKKRGY